jgi:hypothetical protein
MGICFYMCYSKVVVVVVVVTRRTGRYRCVMENNPRCGGRDVGFSRMWEGNPRRLFTSACAKLWIVENTVAKTWSWLGHVLVTFSAKPDPLPGSYPHATPVLHRKQGVIHMWGDVCEGRLVG